MLRGTHTQNHAFTAECLVHLTFMSRTRFQNLKVHLLFIQGLIQNHFVVLPLFILIHHSGII